MLQLQSILENINIIMLRKNNIQKLFGIKSQREETQESKELRGQIQKTQAPKNITDEEEHFNLLMAQETHEIIPNLFLGGPNFKNMIYLDGTTSNNPPRYNAIVSVSRFCDDCDTRQKPDEDFKFKVLPNNNDVDVDNFKENNSKELFDAIKFIKRHLDQKHKVLVHCRQGIDRSPSVIIAYLMFYYDVTFEQALNYVRSKRYIAQPLEGYTDILKSTEFQRALSEHKNN